MGYISEIVLKSNHLDASLINILILRPEIQEIIISHDQVVHKSNSYRVGIKTIPAQHKTAYLPHRSR